MVSRTSRRLAAPALVACVGVLGSAATAHARVRAGLSVTPAILEHRATVGRRRLVHAQQHDQGDPARDGHRAPVVPAARRPRLHRRRARRSRATCAPARARSRSPPAPRRPLSLRMLRRTSSGSLYGNVDILGKPTNTKGRKGIIPQYRLISTLRLHPSRKSLRLRTGAAQVRGGQVLLPVRNLGNTIDPVGGSFQHQRPDAAQRRDQGRRGAARQARHARPRRHARAQEGPLHDQRDRHPGRPPRRPRARASRSAELRAHEPGSCPRARVGLHARGDADQVRPRRGGRRRLGAEAARGHARAARHRPRRRRVRPSRPRARGDRARGDRGRRLRPRARGAGARLAPGRGRLRAGRRRRRLRVGRRRLGDRHREGRRPDRQPPRAGDGVRQRADRRRPRAGRAR